MRLLRQEETRPAMAALVASAWASHRTVVGVARALGVTPMTARRALTAAGVSMTEDYPGPDTDVPDQLMPWAECAALLGRTEGSLRTWPSRYGMRLDGTGLVSPRKLLDARYGGKR
jgi:hypothetical protein